MIFQEELIADFLDLEKLQDTKNPYSKKEEELCSMADYVSIIKEKRQIMELLIALGVHGFDDKTKDALTLVSRSPINTGLEIKK